MFWSATSATLLSVRVWDERRGRVFSGQELSEAAEKVRDQLRPGHKSIAVVSCDNSFDVMAGYIGALRSGHAVLLMEANTPPAVLARINDVYEPEYYLGRELPAHWETSYKSVLHSDGGSSIWRRMVPSEPYSIHPDTAVLLSTSGSTGSPKLVRLSYNNVQANAESIAQYLGLTDSENAATSLPFSYSYGLSVINSHLATGGGLSLTNASLIQKEFWECFQGRQCTSLAGVPYHYELLERIRFNRMQLPSLKYTTQAGGKMPPERIQRFYDSACAGGWKLFIMYGQTEATARMTYVPFEKLGEKIGSVGIAIPGGRLSIEASQEAHSSGGEVVYAGPNVMMGYAENKIQLSSGDELGGVLHTGDMGYLDEGGFLYITGRAQRFIKVYGRRINLDDLELLIEGRLSVACVCIGQDDDLTIVIEQANQAVSDNLLTLLQNECHIPPQACRIQFTEKIPRSFSGKKNYRSVM